jgi:glycosyltransferase involved in cell wall biosynthesis
MTVNEPWEKSLSERLSMLRSDTHRVAYFAPKPDSASFRYRCYNTTTALNTFSSKISASYFYVSDLPHLRDLSDHADTLVVFRTPYDTDVHRVINRFSRLGKKVIFDIDDLVFDVAFAPLVTSNLNYKLSGKDIDQWFAFIANIGACMKLCDAVTTTNPYLRERVQEFCGLEAEVIPNFLNEEQMQISAQVRHEKENRKVGAEVRLGYFSGSHSHAKDFAVAAHEIAEFLKTSPESTLTILGHLEVPEVLRGVTAQIRRLPFVSFQELQREMGKVDLNVVPLQMSPFTFSKSELKYFEAAIVDTVTMASPTPLFSEVISDSENGFLTPAGQWNERLHGFQGMSPLDRQNIAKTARSHADSNYSPLAMVAKLEKIYGLGH